MFNTQCPAYINLIPIIFHTKLPTTQRNKNMKYIYWIKTKKNE